MENIAQRCGGREQRDAAAAGASSCSFQVRKLDYANAEQIAACGPPFDVLLGADIGTPLDMWSLGCVLLELCAGTATPAVGVPRLCVVVYA